MVRYCPGSQVYIAGMLSRAYLKEKHYKEVTPYQTFQLEHEDVVFTDIETINLAEYLRVSAADKEPYLVKHM